MDLHTTVAGHWLRRAYVAGKSLVISLACFLVTLPLCNVVYGVAKCRAAGSCVTICHQPISRACCSLLIYPPFPYSHPVPSSISPRLFDSSLPCPDNSPVLSLTLDSKFCLDLSSFHESNVIWDCPRREDRSDTMLRLWGLLNGINSHRLHQKSIQRPARELLPVITPVTLGCRPLSSAAQAILRSSRQKMDPICGATRQ